MIDPKIIAIDLDDTLLTEDLTISDRTVSVLRHCASLGIYITISSGRTENSLLPFVRRLDLAGTEQGRYFIAQNGSLIFDLHTRLPLLLQILDKDILLHVFNAAKEFGLISEVYQGDSILVPRENSWSAHDAKLSRLSVKVVSDFETLLKQPIHPKILVPGDPEIIAKLLDKLKDEIGDKCTIFTSKPYFLEILPLNAGKGQALSFLCQKLGIQREQTMAFGDSMNDESLLKYAFHSVAMCNGLPQIQKIARYTTRLSNNQDGVATFLEDHICLK